MEYPDGFSRQEKQVFDILIYVHDNHILPEKRKDFRQAMLTVRKVLWEIDDKRFRKVALGTIREVFKDYAKEAREALKKKRGS